MDRGWILETWKGLCEERKALPLIHMPSSYALLAIDVRRDADATPKLEDLRSCAKPIIARSGPPGASSPSIGGLGPE